jgi:hypothetical protein
MKPQVSDLGLVFAGPADPGCGHGQTGAAPR